MPVDFATRLATAVAIRRTPVLVGLDPRFESLPPAIKKNRNGQNSDEVAEAYRVFCREVIDVVAPLVAIVKPQAAFFEEVGPPGMQALADVIQYARRSGLLVILDGKRNDIGSTATAYANAFLGPDSAWAADAMTVSPYLGEDSITPFVDLAQQRGAGIFVLVKTSNPGGGMFQDLVVDRESDGRDERLYERVADYVEHWTQKTRTREQRYGCVGAVVGATYPQQLADLRQRMPHAWLLVPGFGAQGGAAGDVAGAFDADGFGAIINNSRGIIFAYQRSEFQAGTGPARWQDAVAQATHDMIEQLRSCTAAGRL